MGPELVETLHIVVILSDPGLLSLLQSILPEIVVRLMDTFVGSSVESIDGILPVLDPEDWR